MFRLAHLLIRAAIVSATAVLLICPIASATIHTITSADLPLTIPSSWSGDTVRFFGTKITLANGDAITIQDNCNDLLIDGQSDTLEWGTSGQPYAPTNGADGLVCGLLQRLTVRNLTFYHHPPASALFSGVSLWTKAVRGSSLRNSYFENCVFHVEGGNSQIFYHDGSSSTRFGYNITLRNCKFDDHKNQFRFRTQWDESTMFQMGNLYYGRTNPDFQYHFKIVSCTTSNSHWNNFHVGGEGPGRAVVRFDSSYFFVDARNDTTMNAGECFAIALRSGDDTEPMDCISITNCTFAVGSLWAGGRGLFASGTDGRRIDFADSCIFISHCTMVVHQGWDGGFDIGYGIKFRQDVNGVRIEDNDITVLCDRDPGTNSMATDAVGIELQTTNNNGATKTHLNSSMHWRIKRNKVTVLNLNGEDGGSPEARCIQYSEWFENAQEDIVVDSNLLITTGAFVMIGEGNGPAQATVLRGNTCRYYAGQSPNDNTTWTVFSGPHGIENGGTQGGVDNAFIDGKFENGVLDNHIAVREDSHPHDQWLMYTFTPTVLGNNGSPVRACTLKVTDAYGTEVATKLTNEKGQADFEVPTLYLANDVTGPDRTAFNPYTVRAAKGTDVASHTQVVSWDVRTDSITLANTVGEDPEVRPFSRPIDSGITSGQFFNPLGIPRNQFVCLSEPGDVVAYVAKANNNVGLYLSYNVDSTTPWIDSDPANTPGEDFDHTHLSVYNDTIYLGMQEYGQSGFGGDLLVYGVNRTTNQLVRLWNKDWGVGTGEDLYAVAPWRLPPPANDTGLAVSRGQGNGGLETNSIRWWVSTDRGQNWTDQGFMVNRVGLGRVRLGMMRDWDNISNVATLGAVVDSGDNSIEWWTWNRSGRSFYQAGQAFNRSMFRGFDAALAHDTMRILVGSREATPRDTILTAWDNAKLSTPGVVRNFTECPRIVGSVSGVSVSPYVALTYIEASKRLVLWYTRSDYTSTDSVDIYCVYWRNDIQQWSTPPTKVSDGMSAWKITAPDFVPASHGDVAYCLTDLARVHNGNRYGIAEVIKVIFGDSSLPAQPELPIPIDSTITVRDTFLTEGQTVSLIISIDPPASQTFSYGYFTTNISAVAPGDYTSVMASANILVGSTKDTITITIADDGDDEPSETFLFTIENSNLPGYLTNSLSDLSAIVTIHDNDSPPIQPTGPIVRIRK